MDPAVVGRPARSSSSTGLFDQAVLEIEIERTLSASGPMRTCPLSATPAMTSMIFGIPCDAMTPPPIPASVRRRALTLFERLVVFAVIAVLAGKLLPETRSSNGSPTECTP